MAKIKRVVNTYFWEDKKVQEKFTPEDKYFFLYLLTNPKTTQIGIYEFNIRYASLEMGYSEDTIRGLLDRFENVHKVIKRSGEEIAIKNFLVHSILKGGKPVEDCLKKELEQVMDKSLAMFVKNSVLEKDNINETVRKFLEELSFEENEEKEEESKKEKPTRHKYGEYENVLFTDEEYQKLINEFPNDYQERIEKLSCYIASTGKKYKNFLATIRNWARTERQKQLNKPSDDDYTRNQLAKIVSETKTEVIEGGIEFM